jgi:hypothetical protein
MRPWESLPRLAGRTGGAGWEADQTWGVAPGAGRRGRTSIAATGVRGWRGGARSARLLGVRHDAEGRGPRDRRCHRGLACRLPRQRRPGARAYDQGPPRGLMAGACAKSRDPVCPDPVCPPGPTVSSRLNRTLTFDDLRYLWVVHATVGIRAATRRANGGEVGARPSEVHEIGDAIEAWLAACRASGDPVPAPTTKARRAV